MKVSVIEVVVRGKGSRSISDLGGERSIARLGCRDHDRGVAVWDLRLCRLVLESMGFLGVFVRIKGNIKENANWTYPIAESFQATNAPHRDGL